MSARRVLTREALTELPQRHRARLVNSLSGFKSANLIATAGEDGLPACCMVSSVVHLGSNPALLGVVFRPPGDDAHNYHNLQRSGAFTINHVTASIHEAAHQTSARYPADTSLAWRREGPVGGACGVGIARADGIDRIGRPSASQPLSLRHWGGAVGRL